MGAVVAAGISATVLRGPNVSEAQTEWICTSLADLMASQRQSIAAETPGPEANTAEFAEIKARGLADIDKGVAWAQRGCQATEDGGHLVPGLYKSALENVTVVAKEN